jgi:cytochrome c oxidase subunit II
MPSGAHPSVRSGRLRWLLAVALALFSPLLAAAVAAPEENLNIFDPAGNQARGIRDLFYLVLAITGGIFVLVEGMLVFCIFRFRQHGPPSAVEPPQVYGSKPIELAWTVAPALIVFVLFLVVIRYINEIRATEVPPGALEVIVVGHQWWWEYQYIDPGSPGGKLITANELHIPINRPVHLTLQSVDVIHSFWVPRLAGKTDVVPARENYMWIQADEKGWFYGQCAEYCKGQHANMMIRVFAEDAADFDRWLVEQRKPAVADPAARRDLFLSLSCVNCHMVRGTPAKGTFGPDLTHLMSRKTLVTGVVANDAPELTAWVRDPQTIKPGCLMPDMHLTSNEVNEVVKYLLTLK